MDKNELTLKHVKVLFVELDADNKYGASITIDATDSVVRDQIIKWAKENKLTEPKFKEYTNEKTNDTTIQYNVKLAKFVDINDKDGLGYGAVVNLLIGAYDYENNFGKGTSKSVKAIFVVEPKKNSNMDKIAE